MVGERAASGRREPQLPREPEDDQRGGRGDRHARVRRTATVGAAAWSIAAYDASNGLRATLRGLMAGPPAAERWAAAVGSWPWLSSAETLVRRFRDSRLALTAGSLTFTTIISLVPLITVMLALFSAFPMFATLQVALQKYFLETLVPDAIVRPVMGAIARFATRASRLGTVGLIALVVSALAMMLTIDRALNTGSGVSASAAASRSEFAVYWAAVTLGPLMLAISLTRRRTRLRLRQLFGDIPRRRQLRGDDIDFLLQTFGGGRAVPLRAEHRRCAGATRSPAVSSSPSVPVGRQARAGRLPGRGAGVRPRLRRLRRTVPIFLIWIYFIWVIILLGAVIAAYAPLLGKRLRRWPDAPGAEFAIFALVVLRELAAAHGDGRRGTQAEEIADSVGIDR